MTCNEKGVELNNGTFAWNWTDNRSPDTQPNDNELPNGTDNFFLPRGGFLEEKYLYIYVMLNPLSKPIEEAFIVYKVIQEPKALTSCGGSGCSCSIFITISDCIVNRK